MIHPGLIPTLPPPLRGTATNQSPRTAPPTPTGTWAVWGTGRAREKPTRSTGLRPGSPLGKRPGAAPSIYAHKPCLRQWGRSLLPLSRVLSCWGPRPPGQQSAARPSECLSHHGFVSSSSTSSGTFAPGSLGSDPVSGDLRVARARVLGQRVDLPPRPRTVGTHRTGPRFPGVRCAQVGGGGHRPFVLLLRHTHGFSVLLSGKTVLCQGARCGGRGAGWVGACAVLG